MNHKYWVRMSSVTRKYLIGLKIYLEKTNSLYIRNMKNELSRNNKCNSIKCVSQGECKLDRKVVRLDITATLE